MVVKLSNPGQSKVVVKNGSDILSCSALVAERNHILAQVLASSAETKGLLIKEKDEQKAKARILLAAN